jgi:hypothetical protein
VNTADAVLPARSPYRQRRHAETLAGVCAQFEKRRGIHPALGNHHPKIFPHHVGGKNIVPCGHRSVGGKDRGGGDGLHGGVKIQPLANQLADPLQHQKGRMAFIDMPNAGRQPHRPQGAHSADTEDDLLLKARLQIAAIEAMGNIAVLLRVFRDVRIQQIQADPPDLRHPELGLDDAAGKAVEADEHLAAVMAQHRTHGQVLKAGIRIIGLLVALGVDALGEITLPVENTHAHEGQGQIAGGLAVIAGENAQPAGINGKALMQTVFGAKIADEVIGGELARRTLRLRLQEIGVAGRQDAMIDIDEHAVLGRGLQAAFIHQAQEELGIVTRGPPQGGVQAGKEAAGLAVPAIPEVFGEIHETGQFAGDFGIDLEKKITGGHASLPVT